MEQEINSLLDRGWKKLYSRWKDCKCHSE